MTAQAKEPRAEARRWEVLGPWRGDGGNVGMVYRRGKIRVVSSLDDAQLPDGSGERGPQWHVSISRAGKRARPEDVSIALRAFGLVGAEEDNHHPGVARHYWLPVDPARRVACECKANEETIREADGYEWTNPTDAPCRGCEFERERGRRCPIHNPAPGLTVQRLPPRPR